MIIISAALQERQANSSISVCNLRGKGESEWGRICWSSSLGGAVFCETGCQRARLLQPIIILRSRCLIKACRRRSPRCLTCPQRQAHGHRHTVSWLAFMLQSELQGAQQPEETERVPDNYPHRLPPLSGRREHTQSNTEETRQGTGSVVVHTLLNLSDVGEQRSTRFLL